MAPLINRLKTNKLFECVVVLTGQHPEMARQVLEWFKIKPDLEFNIDRTDSGLNSLNSQLLAQIGGSLFDQNPDLVVVQGDTASAFSGALAAFNLQIPVAHLEAGLRTHNSNSPFPEEAYRQMISRISTLHFCPTQGNAENLMSEGLGSENIMVTGNTVVDAFSVIQRKIQENHIKLNLPKALPDSNLVLVTSHRRENLESGILEIASAISQVSETHPYLSFLIPLHPNPGIREIMVPVLSGKSNVYLLEPLGYPEFITMLSMSKFVLTDSGGVQEEAPILGVPAFVMRENTERPEGISSGAVKMIGVDRSTIVELVDDLMSDDSILASMANASNPYGDGSSSERCVSLIEEFFDLGKRTSEFQHV